MKPLDHLGRSLWAATANPPLSTEPLDGERRADVVIVGAGFTGLSCAVHLADGGAEVVVLEARGIGHGGSGRNMGQVNPGVWADPSPPGGEASLPPARAAPVDGAPTH